MIHFDKATLLDEEEQTFLSIPFRNFAVLADFGNLGVQFWDAVRAAHAHSEVRRVRLELLCVWRNAIAHQDFGRHGLPPDGALGLREVSSWRSACHGLAQTFDNVICDHLDSVLGSKHGSKPW